MHLPAPGRSGPALPVRPHRDLRALRWDRVPSVEPPAGPDVPATVYDPPSDRPPGTRSTRNPGNGPSVLGGQRYPGPRAADSAIASSAAALRTASSRVVPCGVPSAIDRRKSVRLDHLQVVVAHARRRARLERAVVAVRGADVDGAHRLVLVRGAALLTPSSLIRRKSQNTAPLVPWISKP